MKRRIAFIGYDASQTRRFFREFCEDNVDQIRWIQRQAFRCELMDGTEVFAVLSDRLPDGLRVDQIILADDSRRMGLAGRSSAIWALLAMQARSDVPIEFAVQWYDVDAPRPQ